jgi:hypothetical protein
MEGNIYCISHHPLPTISPYNIVILTPITPVIRFLTIAFPITRNIYLA